MRLDQGSIGKISDFIAQHAAGASIIMQESEDRIRVNDMIIKNVDGVWQVMRRGELLDEFMYRSWAVAYAVAYANGNSSVNQFLSTSEQKLAKLTTDKDLYKYHRNQALKRCDELKAYIIEDRLSRTNAEISELIGDARQVLLYQRMT